MELPNSHFDSFPIDFKQINKDDFPDFSVSDKIVISPNDDGFIGEALISNMNLEEKNTVVINAAVGQGKTTAIMKVVKDYYDNTDYLIFIVSPYTSLVEQYYKKTASIGIPEEDIYRYELIGKDMSRDAWNSRVQIATVNCLLGNPGEESLINREVKRNYINYLKGRCEESGKKVIFIYDEIHDSIHNFKERYIFTLWKWRNVIHKNFILSATYNEASKVVIEYLAELTDDKIQIIESERKVFLDKQSELFLHFNTASSYSESNDGIQSIVEDLIAKGKKIDILSYSKNLADKICNNIDSGIGKLLFDAFGEINNCTSDSKQTLEDIPVNRYNPEKCNVGTNFKSGVSIEKEDHALIIILPPLGAKGNLSNYGIFSDGINSIIQGLARQRTKGEIHIILPPPDKFDSATLRMSEELKEKFMISYEVHQDFKASNERLVQYYSFNQQDELLKTFYDEVIHENVRDEEEYIQSLSRENKPSLTFPTYKNYKLLEGEKYFPRYHKFFGGDLSSFVLYSALTNQFVNCRLAGTNAKSLLIFEEGKIQWKLQQFVSEYLGNFSWLLQTTTSKYFYNYLKDEIFSNYKVFYKDPAGRKEIIKDSHKKFEQQLLAFVQRKFYPQNKGFNSQFYSTSGFVIDASYSRGDYLMSCISHALKMNESPDDILDNDKLLIQAYLDLNHFREKMLNSIITTRRGQRCFTNDVPEDFILPDEMDKYNRMIEVLITYDPIISKSLFDFKNLFTRSDYSEAEKIKGLYNYMKFDFFKGKSKKFESSTMDGYYFVINEDVVLPDSNLVMNFLSIGDFSVPEETIPTLIIDSDGNTFIQYSNGDKETFSIT
ncbi:DEAD/DEAH box helicase [Chryseobacterium gleum]|uniref:DEAD/DEAH box helicase n=1 Tax=Chryseobacterium gleum TaxID=250 RepID=UPI0024204903|nr:DEAD/DEAH box helicase [Chryseobacterium gleum]